MVWQQQQQQQQQQQHPAATTSKSYPALVVLDSDAAAGGDGGILYPSGNINLDHAVPYGTTSQHNYTLCYPHYPSSATGAPGSSHSGSSVVNPATTVLAPRSASPLASSSRAHTNTVLNSTNSSGNDTTKKLNRLSTSSSLSIITPPTTPKRPGSCHRTAAGTSSGSTGRLKMALSASLAQNFNQKLANLNDKWNDFSFLLLKAGSGATNASGVGGAAAGSGRTNVRNDSYHSIESAVTCTAADFEAGNFYNHRESESESNQEFRTTQQKREPSGSRSMAGPSTSRSRDQRPRKTRLRSSRRNSASGDPKEFDMLVLKPIDTGDDDNESF
ncbi:uncharacterized protein LOC126560556 [Anopheles maculipalpis]|uniref:uncharacterized protein LOC126560556 n=1 Tax=Anopheles maculipalpis TaxID=1496333 RepID=UPI002159667C|nr:uncharacterized protein LOC126560556 [Anopheles maculipalpis]